MSAEGYKYFILYNGEQKLARVQGILNAHVFHHEGRGRYPYFLQSPGL